MSSPEDDRRVERLTREIQSLAEEFAARLGPPLTDALQRSLDAFVVERAEWFNRLDDAAVTALRGAVRDGIERAVAEVQARVRDPDLWVNPTIQHSNDPTTSLDSLNHRVWIAILNGADALDPVLTEFGLDPNDVPDFGGGHFGIQPQRARDVDPRGQLGRLWRRYLELYGRRRALLQRIPAERKAGERDTARRRWFGDR